MCGIAAIFNPTGSVSKDKLSRATRALAHRGPDGEGLWISKNKNVGLGHRRLAIIDPKGGAQPITTLDGNVAATVNGEFYDYKKIRKALRQKGYVFKTKTDSEIVLYLYQEYGLDFVSRLRGEFALALYDARKNALIAVRDRFGIKPLQYYLDSNKTLYIASEAKALFAAGIDARWDRYALYHSCSLQYLPQDRTLFRGVYQLKPGHMLIYDEAGLKFIKYWDLNFPKENAKTAHKYDEEAFADKLENLLKDSVAVRLQTEGAKYCCQVSGGVDSATVAAMAGILGEQKLHCFTVSFPHDIYDELKFAKKIAQHIGADLTPVVVDSSSIVDTISDAVYSSEGMAINSHLAAKYILHREIKKAGYKVVLTGEGADESLAGYMHLRQDLLGAVPRRLKQSDLVAAGVHFAVGESLNLKSVKEKLGYIPAFLQAKASIGYALSSLLNDSFRKEYLVQKAVKDFIDSVDVKGQLALRTKVDQSAYLWIKFALANYILKTLGDGCEMAHSVEGRVPFLDHKFFEFAKTIPLSLKIKDGTQKYILRKVAKKYLPKEIYTRPKQPFMAPPLSLLADKTGINFLNDCFASRAFAEMGFFNQKQVVKLVKDASSLETREQIALEPAIMLMLSAFLIHKNFNLSDS